VPVGVPTLADVTLAVSVTEVPGDTVPVELAVVVVVVGLVVVVVAITNPGPNGGMYPSNDPSCPEAATPEQSGPKHSGSKGFQQDTTAYFPVADVSPTE